MKINHRNKKSAQTIIAYLAFIMVVAAAFGAMIWMFRHKLHASYKESADAFGEGRQLTGTITTTGGVTTPFEFPVLPGGGDAGEAKEVEITLGDCDLNHLNSLATDLLRELNEAETVENEYATAKTRASEEHLAAEEAREAARIAQEQAVAARSIADTWTSDCNSCTYNGNINCTYICDMAAAYRADAARKELDAAVKLANFQSRQKEAERLDDVEKEKRRAAEKARGEATDAALALDKAQKACY